MSNSILDIIEEAVCEFENRLEQLPKVSTAKLGLDHRAGRVWVDREYGLVIADKNNARTLDYYGGFEYVDEYAVNQFGEFKIYKGQEDDRVGRALDHYEENFDG